ncbi:hypothetical protein EVAR_22772_1 [Eumeta japonica]|uniref:Uncharacterized protein n=1 Tax=Eumeta variegata TaxID=151549 RepID=A0A4C1USW0_EUMVA|nr:hypothetical protein EVAR_22772_1 [Eumeta japonica]
MYSRFSSSSPYLGGTRNVPGMIIEKHAKVSVRTNGRSSTSRVTLNGTKKNSTDAPRAAVARPPADGIADALAAADEKIPAHRDRRYVSPGRKLRGDLARPRGAIHNVSSTRRLIHKTSGGGFLCDSSRFPSRRLQRVGKPATMHSRVSAAHAGGHTVAQRRITCAPT